MSMKLQLFPKKLPLLLSECISMICKSKDAITLQMNKIQDSPQQQKILKKFVCFVRDVVTKKKNYIQNRLLDKLQIWIETDKKRVILLQLQQKYQKLLSKIYIVDQDEMFEKFCLQGSLEDNINLLIECSNGLAFSSQPKVSYNCITKQYIVNDAIWFNPKTYQSCTGWITNEFEKAIALLYYQHQQDCIEETNLNKDEDLKRFWIQDFDLRTKILNQIPQICKEFKNAPKKKNTKQEDILWTQLILKQSSSQNDKQINQDQNLQMMLQSINESDVSTIIMNNELESINYMPLEKILTIQILCQRRILRLIRDHYKEKLMKDIQNIEGKEKKKNVEQKKKSKKHKKQKNKNEQKKINMNQDKSISFELQCLHKRFLFKNLIKIRQKLY